MPVLYIGASNRNLGLTQYTIYREKPVKLIETLKAKIPLIERLFVTAKELVQAENDLNKTETIIYKAWQQAKEAKWHIVTEFIQRKSRRQ